MIGISTDTVLDYIGEKRDFQCHRYLLLWRIFFSRE